MKRGLLSATLLIVSRIVGLGQAGNADVKFEVISVKPSPPPDGNGPTVFCKGGPETTDPGLFTCSNINISNLLGTAFQLKPYQLPSADYGDRATYEISARVPPGTTKGQFILMQRNLLIERFKLVYHYEKKEMQVYDLVISKGGLKMSESPPAHLVADNGGETSDATRAKANAGLDAEGFPKVAAPKRGQSSMSVTFNGRLRWIANSTNMEGLVSVLAGQIGGPVTDSTGLHGKYDFTLSWVVDNNAAADPPARTLVEAIQEQLGLKLDWRKGFADVFVIDHVEKVPAEN